MWMSAEDILVAGLQKIQQSQKISLLQGKGNKEISYKVTGETRFGLARLYATKCGNLRWSSKVSSNMPCWHPTHPTPKLLGRGLKILLLLY